MCPLSWTVLRLTVVYRWGERPRSEFLLPFGRIQRFFRSWQSSNCRIRVHSAGRLTLGEIQQNRISPRTRLSNDIPPILGDRVQLQQVVLNLVIEAVEAMSGSGEEERNLLITSAKNGSNNVIVAVLNSSPELDETALAHLFDEFHTTRPDGMGMGLAISRTLIGAHGGQLRAMANPPKGARFGF